MGKRAENDSNLKRYKNRLTSLDGLQSTPELPMAKLIDHLIAEGNALLKTEAVPVKKTSKTKLSAALSTSSSNPYTKARAMVLEKLPEWRRKELARMEKTGDINNRFYQDFISEVSALGDQLSQKQ